MQQGLEVGTRTRIEVDVPNAQVEQVLEGLQLALKVTQSELIGRHDYLYAHSTLLVLLLPCQARFHGTLIDVLEGLKQQRLVTNYSIARSSLLQLTLESEETYNLLGGILYGGEACFSGIEPTTAYLTTNRNTLTGFQSMWLISHDVQWRYI